MLPEGHDGGGGAFAAWVPPALDSLPCIPASPVAPLPQLTAGLAALAASCSRAAAVGGTVTGGDATAAPGHASSVVATAQTAATALSAAASEVLEGGWTLPDGRLRVGTH